MTASRRGCIHGEVPGFCVGVGAGVAVGSTGVAVAIAVGFGVGTGSAGVGTAIALGSGVGAGSTGVGVALASGSGVGAGVTWGLDVGDGAGMDSTPAMRSSTRRTCSVSSASFANTWPMRASGVGEGAGSPPHPANIADINTAPARAVSRGCVVNLR